MKTKLLTDFQICISVPLNSKIDPSLANYGFEKGAIPLYGILDGCSRVPFVNFEPKLNLIGLHRTSQPAFMCSKLTIQTLKQGVKYVQS